MYPIIKHKNFKKFVLIGILSCSIIIYFLVFSPRVQIEVYNKTGFDIDSLNIDNNYYKIRKGKSLVINCRKLKIQDNLPFGTPKGIIENMKPDTTYFLCGTGVEEIRRGNYRFNIEALFEKGIYSLSWTKHK